MLTLIGRRQGYARLWIRSLSHLLLGLGAGLARFGGMAVVLLAEWTGSRAVITPEATRILNMLAMITLHQIIQSQHVRIYLSASFCCRAIYMHIFYPGGIQQINQN